MTAIGAVLLFVGLGLLVLAWTKAKKQGTQVADGPPPPKPARTLMGSGVLATIVGLALMAMSNI